ncbi:S41 family peptidase [Amycolatopsis sp. WGS_07]|uniref:S41 family peptidase n=1 Tax=Amycolatopsis sp. WGS_07 TaxID=3076764 RepID=UPI003873764F
MRRALAAVVVLVLLGAGLVAAGSSAPTPRTYLLGALNLLRTRSIDRDRVDWPRAEAEALRAVEGVSTLSGTYPMIQAVIAELGNPHTSLLSPAASEGAFGGDDRGAVEPRGGRHRGAEGSRFRCRPGGERRYVAAGVAALQAVEARASCGWIVDLRGNSGGNMWPMLTVLAPLLGDGVAGSFVGPGLAPEAWSIRGGRAWAGEHPETAEANPVRLTRPEPPVAVLTSPRTASSGEATLVAFRGLGRVATFGGPTAGFATSNEAFALADGAQLRVTTTFDADRAGRIYGVEPIAPDFPAADPEAAAGRWLRTRGGCA